MDYQRLLARWQGRRSYCDRTPGNARLNEEQAEALVVYCHDRDCIGLPLPLAALREVAEGLLRKHVLPSEEIEPLSYKMGSQVYQQAPASQGLG